VYAPSGAGGVGPYAFTFEILANTDIAVFKDDVLLTLTTHYTVTINANGTGSVTITAAGLALSPTSPTQYAIVGNRTIARSTDFTTGGDFFANTINDELDQQTIFAQQNAEGLQRALTAPQTDPTTIDMTLPKAADRANKTLAFDANGDPTLGISAADVANAVTYATNAANSATAAASSASSASSSASAASGSASTASTQASNASTSATNASNSASSASTSATNAAASASTATTQASNASTSATNASNSASAASTSASNAATSETNAAASASTASTQATNAASSASAASGSATSAANSAAAAASALDSFDDRYLGTKTSDPTLDNDGNALVAGALYFSTTQNVMKVYDGASWITATSAGATSLLRFRYVATSGQTTFSGADAAAATLTYTVNNIAVHRNGVTLDTSEYTASNGTSIVLTVAAGTGDIIDIIAFKSFTVADALSAVSGGTVNGAVTITGVTTVQAGTAALPAITTTGDTNTGIFFPAADTIAFSEGGVESMRIDSSGNVGIGVTPNAWASNYKAIQMGARAAYTSGSGEPYIGNNWYNDGGNKYIATAAASLYGQSGGAHIWYNAASGTAGNAITFTQAMTLSSSGYLGIGQTSPAYYLDILSSGLSGTEKVVLNVTDGANSTIQLRQTTSYSQLYANNILGFGTSGAERARIDSSGNFIVTNGGGNNRIYSTGVYNVTNASAANVIVTSDGGFARSTSSLKYKQNVNDSVRGLSDLLKLRAVTYESKNESEAGIIFGGLIAEEVHEAGLTEFVQYAEDGSPDALAYGNMVSLCINAIKELKALVDTQASTITTLTDRITALENA
jgi:hypothetical protein